MKLIIPKRLVLLSGLLLISYTAPQFASLKYRGKFESYKGSHVFMMNRLISTGILQDYLKDNCEQGKYSLCKYQDQINTSFMWDKKNSPLYKDGGWEGTKTKYTALIKDILTQPKYLKKYIIKSSEAAISQFFYFDIQKDREYGKGTFVHTAMNKYFHDYMSYFNQSLQNQKRFNIIENINSHQRLFIILSLVSTILLLLSNKKFKALPAQSKFIFIFFFLSISLNAIMAGFFSEVRFRYQGRIIWIISLPIFLYSVTNLKPLATFIKSKITSN